MRALAEAPGYLAYLALRGAWWMLALLPLTVARRMLAGLAALVGAADLRHRRIIDANLATAFPGWGKEDVSRIRRAAFSNWGRIVAELVHERELSDAADPALIASLERSAGALLERGRGLLVLTAHTANFELLARIWGRRTGRPLAMFHRSMSVAAIDDFLVGQRADANVVTLRRRQGVPIRDALRRLADGGIFVVPLDQNQRPGKGVFVSMFGRSASTSTLLARLALASGAPVLPVFAVWQGEALSALVGEAIEPPPGAEAARGEERAKALHELTARYTAEVEAAVSRHPEQWNWAHRRWKTRPAEAAATEG